MRLFVLPRRIAANRLSERPLFPFASLVCSAEQVGETLCEEVSR